MSQRLGFLLEHSGDYLKASEYLTRAAEEAAATGSCREAAQFGARALQVLRRVPASLDIHARERELLLQVARYSWHVRSAEHLQRAIGYCTELVAKDPANAAAHSMLATAYLAQAVYGVGSPLVVMPKAREAAMKALDLEPERPATLAVLGSLRLMYDWDFEGARQAFDHAIRLDSHVVTAYHWRSFYFSALLRPEEAVADTKRTRELDPNSLILRSVAGWILYFSRRFEEATAHLVSTCDIDPNFWRPYMDLSMCRMQTGDYEEAVAAMERSVALNENSTTLAILARAYGHAGKRDKALQILSDLDSGSSYVSGFSLAHAAIGLGDNEAALNYLERAYSKREWFLILLQAEPAFDPLRHQTRFQDLVRKVGLTHADAN
jgi:tetratricopeptide (TPR) repeat protein